MKFGFSLCLLTCVAGVTRATESTFDPSGTSENPKLWSTAGNWMHVPENPGKYPDNVTQGGSFDARIDAGVLHLGSDITVSSLVLNLGASGVAEAAVNGNLLTVNGTLTSLKGAFSGGGNVDASTLLLTGSLTLTGTALTVPTAVHSSSASLVLNAGGLPNGGEFVNTGSFTFTGNGSIGFSAGAAGTFDNGSGMFSKTAGTGVSSIGVPFKDNGGTIDVSSGELRFNSSGSTNLTGTTLSASSGALLNL